uniref:Transposase n=1 Tax=Panagrellus redivivus TaxID=6233 RepID=A0A7E4UN36_PANRE
MSIDFKDNVIKRFTYDWLIRFAELDPFEAPKKFHIKDYYHKTSKYSAISPRFTTLISRYMPDVICAKSLSIEEVRFDYISKFDDIISV